MEVKITVDGVEELAGALSEVNTERFHAATKETARNIYNRAVAPGGTPVDTGELRQSAGVDVSGDAAIMGYHKEYAPHVEFGHRTRGGGYVQGQHYLQRNVEAEAPAFKRLLVDELKKALKR